MLRIILVIYIHTFTRSEEIRMQAVVVSRSVWSAASLLFSFVSEGEIRITSRNTIGHISPRVLQQGWVQSIHESSDGWVLWSSPISASEAIDVPIVTSEHYHQRMDIFAAPEQINSDDDDIPVPTPPPRRLDLQT